MIPKRTALLLGLLVTAAACTSGADAGGDGVRRALENPPTMSAFAEEACRLPAAQLRRIWRGYHPERSGNVQFIPAEPNTIGNWFSHAGPWRYLQDVPMFVYGPGQVPATGRVDRRVTLADIAPTLARFIGFDYDAPDGKPMREAIPPEEERGATPRVVVTMVWDSAGDNVLTEHPDAWPTLKRLIPKGVWYERATDGTSPSISGPMHATIGTGAFPRTHGTVDHWFLLDGKMVNTEKLTPTGAILVPTLADLYDKALGNEPVVAAIGSNPWHLAMAGQGALFDGGDKDIAAGLPKDSWDLSRVNRPYYDFPEYVQDIPRPQDVARRIDLEDGAEDGTWHGDADILESVVRSEWQTRALQRIIRREGFGADAVPDLLFVNYKQVDEVGHKQTMNSDAMWLAVNATDRALGRLIEILDQEVGRGKWVLVVTSEHGATPKLDVSGGFQIEEQKLRDDIVTTFDSDDDKRRVLLQSRPTQMWINERELRENGFTLEQVAAYLADYTPADNVADPSLVPKGIRDKPLMAAAFPGSVLESLPCLSRG